MADMVLKCEMLRRRSVPTWFGAKGRMTDYNDCTKAYTALPTRTFPLLHPRLSRAEPVLLRQLPEWIATEPGTDASHVLRDVPDRQVEDLGGKSEAIGSSLASRFWCAL
ncbi:hypothetical protein MRX96_018337 [Rhipicephalus microplus]